MPATKGSAGKGAIGKRGATSGNGGHRLVIVESPAKARTIAGYLGTGYVVESSIGHVRDMPDKAAEIPEKYRKEPWARLGVDVDRAAVEGPLGADFGKTGRVDLSSPAVDFRVLVGTEFVLGRVVHRVDRSGLEARKVTNRAFRLPISLHPKLARALVNLSRVPTGGPRADPVCGTGGLVPAAEELLFRGLFYGWLRGRCGVAASTLISAGLFAPAHVNAQMGLQIFVIGIVLAQLYERSRTVLAPIVAHATINTLSVMAIVAYANAQ